jgi:hypothetical protein
VLQLLVTADAVSSSLIRFTLMMEATHSSERPFTRATRHHIPEDGIFLVTAVKTSNLKKLQQAAEKIAFISTHLSRKSDGTAETLRSRVHFLPYSSPAFMNIRHYVRSRKVAGSSPEEVTELFPIDLIIQAVL